MSFLRSRNRLTLLVKGNENIATVAWRRFGKLICCAIAFALTIYSASGASCPPVSESLQSKIIQAARDKHQIAGEVPLRVASIVQMAGTCFRNLKLTSGGSQYPYNISVYLSSDNRFLATGVLDLEEGVLQNGAKQATIFAGLTVGRHVTYGPADAPTLVSIIRRFLIPALQKIHYEGGRTNKNGSLSRCKTRVSARPFPNSFLGD